MTTEKPQRPDIARELIARATESAAHRATRVRTQLDGVQLGRGRHTDYANAKFLHRVLGEYELPPIAVALETVRSRYMPNGSTDEVPSIVLAEAA
ncbi:hypothetical protein EF914_03880 [Streptomyces sp. WAC05458]|uniref:hypothetical protein n=1 Tax=Streptomyces sp. WAC05458 TaxID=2487412 RepID=UPI000FA3E25A|nr:hypothetical protein [Streptomyces sp. WAC05458]RSS26003.1 hypothetical protein EF914_03880 [Streptomyces sp. WAC05458]